MILIAGTVDVDPEQRDRALTTGADLMRETRTQKGCLDYVWSADPAVPGRIYVFERWESTADLAAHLAGEYYRQMREHIGSHGLRAADVHKYAIERFEPVYDETGTARADFFTR
ncbi:MAG: antibiotic biosynthesis monooxygenase [Proteobacteria bacterium]|nr:antibiotic biosynthesis monooxygenase [Pseudomonadota bacterium]